MLRGGGVPTVERVKRWSAKTYMVERYLPGLTAAQAADARERIAAATGKLARIGVQLSYLGSTFVPEEESCFCRFEAESRDAVEVACALAAVPFARIVETRDFDEKQRRGRAGSASLATPHSAGRCLRPGADCGAHHLDRRGDPGPELE